MTSRRTPRRRRIGLALVGLTAAPIVFLVVAFNVPVSLTLGPCLKDWTSPSSYQTRASKLASVDVRVGQETVRVCYGRPSARGRVVFGGLVSYDRLWRAGANEPTRLFTRSAINAGGVRLEPGRYSLYVLPSDSTWEFFFSRSTFHWGNVINRSVREREVGSTIVPVGVIDQFVEVLTVRGETTGEAETDLFFEWEHTQVKLALTPAETVNPD